jgi:hypothetical protein
MIDWNAAQQKAAKTARWSITMTRWLIARLKLKRSWNLVTFTGSAGGESAGIVDILAIRKDHRKGANGLKRGDAFEIILIQVKGGNAAWPSEDDIKRLRKVGDKYDAKAVILAEWKKGKQPVLYQLGFDDVWKELEHPLHMFK